MGYRETYFKHKNAVNGLYQCPRCMGWYRKEDIDVDHKIAKRLGGTDDIWNLQGLCYHCNRSKGDNTSGIEVVDTVARGFVDGVSSNGLNGALDNIGSLGKSVAKQKLKDALGIKYRR